MALGLRGQGAGDVAGGHRVLDVLYRARRGVSAYRALPPGGGKPVVLRILAPLPTPELTEHFLARVRVLSSLRHPGIPPLLDAGESTEGHFVTTPELEGVTLRELIPSGGMSPMRAIRLLGEAADALDAAHAVGLVHGDVRPETIMVQESPHERALLADFPLLPPLRDHSMEPVHDPYTAPERARGGPASPAADIYSLACVLYECITSRLPFGPGGTEWAGAGPPSLARDHPGLAGFQEPLSHGLAQAPTDRPDRAATLIGAAARALIDWPAIAESDRGGAPEHHEAEAIVPPKRRRGLLRRWSRRSDPPPAAAVDADDGPAAEIPPRSDLAPESLRPSDRHEERPEVAADDSPGSAGLRLRRRSSPNVPKLRRAGNLTRLGEAARYRDLVWDRAGQRIDLGAQTRVAALRALADFYGPEVRSALTEALSDPDARVRDVAIDGLRRQGTREAALALVHALITDESIGSPDIRAAVLGALGEMRTSGLPECMVRALIEYKEGPVTETDRQGLSTLLSRDEREAQAVPAVAAEAMKFLDDEHPKRRAQAERVLAWHVRYAVGPLLGRLETGSPRPELVRLLGMAGDPQAVELLVSLLQHSEPATRCAAAEALGGLKDKRAVEPLLAATRDPELEVRNAAMVALDGMRVTAR